MRPIDADPSININELAEITEGYSGAEIVDICQNAGYATLEKGIETGVKELITLDIMRHVIDNTSKGVTSEQIQGYEQWRLDRR